MQLKLPDLHKQLKQRLDLANCSDFLGLLWKEILEIWKKCAINFCVHIRLWTNIFFNIVKQLKYKSMDDAWTYSCSLLHCNVNIVNNVSSTTYRVYLVSKRGEWVYRPVFSWLRHYLEVSGQLYVPAALPPGKEPPEPIGYGPQSRSGRSGEKKIIDPTGTRTPSGL
jgi:hypothetical protein